MGDERSPSSSGGQSPDLDRNPSPPPDTAGGGEDGDSDAIGDTVYSKHWLFSTLTRLINVGFPLSSLGPSLTKVCFLNGNDVFDCLWIVDGDGARRGRL